MPTKARRSEFLIFWSPAIGEEEIAEVVATLRSGWLGTGPRVQRLKTDFRSYVGRAHAVALSSCTAGLHLALEVLGIGAGDEVITSLLTFSATANVFIHVGATPVFVDVDPRTMNLNPKAVERAVTSRTKTILPVHLADRPCDMDAILQVARLHDLRVIEDAAHAIGGRYRGRAIGTIGDASVFNFYVTKNLVTGEGGMPTTENAAWADEILIHALHGISKDPGNGTRRKASSPTTPSFPGTSTT
jgi:dTDP-4-amino-4,6-dideoxygalactose transaminase